MSSQDKELKIDYYYCLYLAKTKLNMSEEEFWRSTLYKINRMVEFYIKDHKGPEDTTSKVIENEEILNKWGRPIIRSNEF